jgi:hypothetical protein
MYSRKPGQLLGPANVIVTYANQAVRVKKLAASTPVFTCLQRNAGQRLVHDGFTLSEKEKKKKTKQKGEVETQVSKRGWYGRTKGRI